jgi:5'-nucleotidase
VVLTNDDGVESPGLRALARAFARAAETWVVAPAADRSGSTNYSRALAERRIAVERRDLVTGVRAYAVDGFPADAVIVALRSELLSGPPDLVISGINVGPNLATDWAYSGTIGAARTAALLGVRALAVSGLEPTDSVTAAAIADWIVALAASPIVRELEPGQYLTVSFPRRPAGEIGGPDVTRRGGPRWSFELRSNVDASTDGRRVYDLHLPEAEVPTAEGTDVAAYGAGRIAIVGMRVDEQDPELQRRLVAQHGALPGWPARQR